jgi:A/G-specific adenine glycosylase
MDFTKTLTYWYSEHKRDLPWRQTREPYFIWLSEIIMQQTQVKQGLPYYEAFTGRFPTIYDLASVEEGEVLKLWQGLGYYSRARNLHATARYIVRELNGEFPETYKELLKLKGVGDYTASAIASICFNEPRAVVDGNVYRVLSRYFAIDTPIDSAAGKKLFKGRATELLPDDNFGDYNQAIMEFGARQCKPQSPDCGRCPLSSTCGALQLNRVGQLPVKSGRSKIARKHFNYLVFISKDRRTILQKRREKGIWRHLYQFPLAETDRSLSKKDFMNEPTVRTFLNGSEHRVDLYNEDPIVHKLSHQHLYTKFWILEVDELPMEGIEITEIASLPVPTLISNFIREFNFSKAL